jgi:uncharacterized protein YodC (DUF2158 family)
MSIEAGSLVRLKSGGPVMVVEVAQPDQVGCAWFADGEARHQRFAPGALVEDSNATTAWAMLDGIAADLLASGLVTERDADTGEGLRVQRLVKALIAGAGKPLAIGETRRLLTDMEYTQLRDASLHLSGLREALSGSVPKDGPTCEALEKGREEGSRIRRSILVAALADSPTP